MSYCEQESKAGALLSVEWLACMSLGSIPSTERGGDGKEEGRRKGGRPGGKGK